MRGKKSSVDIELETKRSELRKLNAQIAERTQYLKSQELLIDETVQQGNTKFMGLVHDIELAKKELRDLKTDIRTAAQDKVILNEDLEALRGELTGVLNTGRAVPAFG